MKGKKKFWSFKASSNGVAQLFIHGDITSQESWWGDGSEVTPNKFKEELNALGDVSEINVYVNSDGGDVFAGQAIHSMMKRHKAKINVYIDGLAASIASVIAMAGDTVYMPRNAMMMIHNPWTLAYGNSQDFRKVADDLDQIRESMIAAYQDKSGIDRDQLIALLDAETWLTAEEALSYGLIDEIEQSKEIAASINAGVLLVNGQEMDLSKYKNSPKILVATTSQVDNVPEEKTENTPSEQRQVPLSLFEKYHQLQGRVLK